MFFFFSNHGWLYVQWTFVIVTYQIDIFDKYVGGHLSLACKFKFKRIQIRDCECFFPFHLLFFSLFVVVVFYFSLFLLFIMPLKLIKLQTQKNVGLVIIQGVVRRCSIEGRQKTVSNSLVSISEIKANLWLSAFWFVYCTCICCGSDLIFGLNFFNLGTNNGGDFPQESLLAIYNRIKKVQYLL